MTRPRPHWIARGRRRASAFTTGRGAMRGLHFAERVFGARPLRPTLLHADEGLWNAELALGDSTILIGDAPGGMTRSTFPHVHVPDVDNAFALAAEVEATPVAEPDGFYGDRDGGVEGMADNRWWIATHVEDLSDEIVRRSARAESRR